MKKEIRVISIENRPIKEEAQRILATANSMFSEVKYKIKWIRVSEGGNIHEGWAVLDGDTGARYESFDDNDQDCVIIAERALKIAVKEYDKLYGEREISIEAQEILDTANEMFEEEARYNLIWSRERDVHGKVWYRWKIFDSRKNKNIIPSSANDQNCVEMAKEALLSAKRSASSGSKKYYDGKGKPPVHKSFSFSHDLYKKMEKESKLRGLDIKEFMVSAVEKMIEELEKERELRKDNRK